MAHPLTTERVTVSHGEKSIDVATDKKTTGQHCISKHVAWTA
jgi:hypothetical protein